MKRCGTRAGSAHTNEVVESWFREADAFLFGRASFNLLGGYWPKVTEPDDLIATKLNTLPKYVVSSTLTDEEADWSPTTVLRGELVDEVRRLKELPGRELQVHGSWKLVQTLHQAGTCRPLPAAPVPSRRRDGEAPVPGRIDARDVHERGRVFPRTARRRRLADPHPCESRRDLRGCVHRERGALGDGPRLTLVSDRLWDVDRRPERRGPAVHSTPYRPYCLKRMTTTFHGAKWVLRPRRHRRELPRRPDRRLSRPEPSGQCPH